MVIGMATLLADFPRGALDGDASAGDVPLATLESLQARLEVSYLCAAFAGGRPTGVSPVGFPRSNEVRAEAKYTGTRSWQVCANRERDMHN